MLKIEQKLSRKKKPIIGKAEKIECNNTILLVQTGANKFRNFSKYCIQYVENMNHPSHLL